MRDPYEWLGWVITGLAIGFVATVVFSKPAKAAEEADCKASRMVSAYAWLALDDARRDKLDTDAIKMLDMELAASVEVATATCAGEF